MQNFITPTVLMTILRLMGDVGIAHRKREIITQYTNGRVSQARHLTPDEATYLIEQLKAISPRENLKSEIYELAHQAGIIWGDSVEDEKMNMVVLRDYIKQKGVVKKHINDMSEGELQKVHRQFMTIVRNRNTSLKHVEAKKITDALLKEMQLTVQD